MVQAVRLFVNFCVQFDFALCKELWCASTYGSMSFSCCIKNANESADDFKSIKETSRIKVLLDLGIMGIDFGVVSLYGCILLL